MKRIIAIVALILIGALSASAMDAIRVAGVSSSTNVKNVTLDLTVRVYDAANFQIWSTDVVGVHFDNQGVFSFILNPDVITYNPLYNVKIENTSNGIVVFESRLDKIVAAQSQLGSAIDPSEVNLEVPFYFHEVIVQDGLAQVGLRLPNEEPTISMFDPLYIYDQSGTQTFGVALDGDMFTQGDATINNDLTVVENTMLNTLHVANQANFNGPVTAYNTAEFQGNTEFSANSDFQSVNIHKEVVGEIQDGTGVVAITPTMPILNIGTLTQIKTLINGTAGQIVYVVGNTNGFTLQGVSFSVGATYVCTATNVWVCVGKN